MKRNKPACLVELRMTGNDGFQADKSWREGIRGKLICPHCLWPYPHVKSIDAYVSNRRRQTDVDSITPFVSAVRALSQRLIDLAGQEGLEQVAGLGRIFDVRGFEHQTHRTAVANHSVVIRDESGVGARLCRECDRLLYASRGCDQYVLRSQLPEAPFFISGRHVFCTEAFWKKHIFGGLLTRVEAIEIPIREVAADGLPESTSEIEAFLKKRRRYV